MLDDLKEIIAIGGVEEQSSGAAAPFGDKMREALDWFLDKAASYGLRTGENAGYYGWAEYGAKDAPMIGIAAHIDVVPAGEGWQSPPFEMRLEDGKVYGRGVADDKGPLVAALHVLKKFRDENAPLAHRIRLIVGCNEETGSRCLKKYAAEDEIPVVTLVPDSDFPVINSEKGILHTDAHIRPDSLFSDSVKKLYGGERANVVPDSATLVLSGSGEAAKRLAALDPTLTDLAFSSAAIVDKMIAVGARAQDYAIERTLGDIKITASGRAGHAMAPEKADNALWKIFAVLAALLPHSQTVGDIWNNVCCHDAAKIIGAYREDTESGKLTMNLGAADFDGGELKLKFDFRLPLVAQPDETEAKLKSALSGAVIKRARFADNLYMPTDSPLISTLLEVYSKMTGEINPQPIQTGGGTYARELPNAVAFGPTFRDADTCIHDADENISVAHLYKLCDIYDAAIRALDNKYQIKQKTKKD